MPEEWASMRSMARWVLPVLVGPSTAVTPWPRARGSRSPGELNEMGIPASASARTGRRVAYTSYLYHNATKAGGTAAAPSRLGTSLEQSAPESLTPPPLVSFSPTSGESLSSFHQILNHSACFDAKTPVETLAPRAGSRSLRSGFRSEERRVGKEW